jgi:hypothetical protein
MMILLAGCQAESNEDVACEDSEKCDQLQDFENVRIKYGEPSWICADNVFDSRCKGFHEGEPSFPGKFYATANVNWVSDSRSELVMAAEDNRILAPAARVVRIELKEGLLHGESSFGGLLLDYRIDGETEWKSASLPAPQHWREVEILPEIGSAQGYARCYEAFCGDDKKVDQTFPDLPPTALVEYRLTVLPEFNWGDFDTGLYEFYFSIE